MYEQELHDEDKLVEIPLKNLPNGVARGRV